MECRALGSMMSYPWCRSLFQAQMSCLRTCTRPSKWSAHWDSRYRKYMLVLMTAYCFAESTKTIVCIFFFFLSLFLWRVSEYPLF
jgi:hypothetical protein